MAREMLHARVRSGGRWLGGGAVVPVPGGVLVRDKKGKVIGAVGVTGDTCDNDEIDALAGVAAAGFEGNA